MRLAHAFSALAASLSLAAAPVALAQNADGKAAQPPAKAAAPAAKPAAKTADGKTAPARVDGAAAVRTTPADIKKDQNYDGCGHGKMSASDA